MKLKGIDIEHFKCIEKISINIENLAMLIGENGAGKSNVLRAIEGFYQDSIRGINEEYFYYKDRTIPIQIILTYNRLMDVDKAQKYLKHWIYNEEIRVKKEITFDTDKQKYEMKFYGWQAAPKEKYFDLSQFESYKSDLKKIISDNNLPDYFKTGKGMVNQASYKEGVAKHIEEGKVEFGEPIWIPNPAGLKEVFADLLPKFYLVPAVKDAQDESKVTQQTVLGKLIADLTNRIVLKNPQFKEVDKQLAGLKKFLNKGDSGADTERLKEIIDFEKTMSAMISENMPGTKVGIEITTPELIDLFKDVKITLDDTLPTSIDAKGHGLQRALIFAYIRAYAKTINSQEVEDEKEKLLTKNFVLAVEEPELYLHPNGQRKMLKVLIDIAQTDQVIACTHSNFFVDMFEYKNIVIVSRDDKNPTKTVQFIGEIFQSEEAVEKKRLQKTFRYLSLFDLSRSEMFFARKVVLVEGDTEKFMIPFWASRYGLIDSRYDFSSQNICIVEAGGKTNLHIFMRVLNQFKIPYVVIHDVDPVSFAENKPNKTDKEKAELKMFKENEFIKKTLNDTIGNILQINPELESIIEVSSSQADKHGKIGAAYFKYDETKLADYPSQIKEILDSIINWECKESSKIIT